MVSWAITGATRGIGLEYVNNLSADSNNEVFALIRSRTTAGALEDLAADRKNIHIIETDISRPEKLKETAAEISKSTNGSLDVVILNASSPGPDTFALSPSDFRGKEEALENEFYENVKANIISNIYVIDSLVDLIRKGHEKKIVFISSQSGDIEFNRITGLTAQIGYSVSKAGMNLVMTKIGAELAQEGIKTLSLSPGWVNTDAGKLMPREILSMQMIDIEAAKAVTGDPDVRKWIIGAFHKVDPNVEGPRPVEESVADQLRVIGNLSAAESGKFLTHHGNHDQWF
ncbi:unnamed protein product [Periconia digitata]|uniref:NAD(P)-binding protein n=1 Tax=Periconia digitata TaxID=1303443 RepID=A0A9W4U6F4_9PLEO|nr:unnamed protein product [Periconia digitata]